MKLYGKVITDQRNIVVIHEPPSRESTRITSRDIFGLAECATSGEAKALLKAKDDENKVVVAAVAARKDQTCKKATNTS